MGGLLSFFGILLALVCIVLPAQARPRLWATLAALAMLLSLAGIPHIPQ
jgi:hypothetical protein